MTIRHDLMSEAIATLWLQVTRSDGRRVLMCGVYREWDHEGRNSMSDQSERLDVLTTQLDKGTLDSKSVVVLGDINLCSNQWNEPSYRLKSVSDAWREKVSACGLELLELGDTYFADHPNTNGIYVQSALDHIYVSDKELVDDHGKLLNSATDHYPIFINVKHFQTREKFRTKVITKRSFKKFSAEKFAENAAGEQVKMIEVKLSQGAKPGHGGILPGAKVTEAIAEARGQTLAQMALAWVLRDGRITSALIGASKPEQVVDCVGAVASTSFTADELARIDAIAEEPDLNLWARSSEGV